GVGSGNYQNVKGVLEQLEEYPLARYQQNHSLKPNLSYMQTNYVAGLQPGVSGGGGDPILALNLQIEMAKHWNYYFNVWENVGASNLFNDEFKNYAQANVGSNRFKYAIISSRMQLSSYGSVSSTYSPCLSSFVPSGGYSLVAEKHIEDNAPATCGTITISSNDRLYYLDDNTQNPPYFVTPDGNPTGDIDTRFIDYSNIIDNTVSDCIYDLDGEALKYFLDVIDNTVNPQGSVIPIDYIAENNEVLAFGNPNLIGMDAEIDFDYNNLNYSNYNDFSPTPVQATQSWDNYMGIKRMLLDNQFRDIFMNQSKFANTLFLNYAVDGADFPSSGRFPYNWTRGTQKAIGSQYYPTPDFYPRRPYFWRNFAGDIHGWQWLMSSRNTELQYGDYRFAPYVAAGWSKIEEENFTPGHWLGILKNVAMLGVDFFHTGHFKIEKYNADYLPADPKGYIWQAAIPTYAQAIASRYETFLTSGYLMRGDAKIKREFGANTNGYSYNAGRPDIVVTARKMNGQDKYVISGSLQAYSTIEGNANDEAVASIDLHDNDLTLPNTNNPHYPLTFNVRKQGSTYIYDRTVNPPIFYQLDTWHEAKHPERWTKDFRFEAEVYDNTSALANVDIKTDASSAPDYSNFTSYLQFSGNGSTNSVMEYRFHPRSTQAKTYYVWIRARNAASSASANINIEYSDGTTPVSVETISCLADNSAGWQWYHYKPNTLEPISFTVTNSSDIDYTLLIQPDGSFDIDQIILSEDKNLDMQPGDKCSLMCSVTPTTVSSHADATHFPTGFPDQTVELQTDFTVDADFNISGKTLIIDPGVTITVESGKTLTIDNSHFSTCGNNLWGGIILEDGAILDIQNSVIEDATAAISAPDGCDITALNNVFDHNDIAIDFFNMCHHGSSQSAIIQGNLFTCRDRDVKTLSRKSSVHIRMILNDGFTIGDVADATKGNIFEYCSLGMEAGSSSNMVIANNTFRKLIPDPLYPDAIPGTGILLDPNCPCCAGPYHAPPSSNNVITKNFFDYIPFAINCSRSYADITENVFTNTVNAIVMNEVDVDFSTGINITDNSIGETESGILLVNCIGNTVNITGNYISVLPEPDINHYTTGIDIESVASSNLITINDNLINTKGTYGIKISNELAPSITENRINLRHPYAFRQDASALPMTGVYLSNVQQPFISCNNLYGNAEETMAYKTALQLDNCPGFLITSNVTGLTEKGMVFIQNCAADGLVESDLMGNTFNEHNYALVAGDQYIATVDGIISDQ
ncbi:MAG TPA: right-handed parallel beta-helix repeat-containing protein, partial [Bacteroidia bacterium]|nr:right-handed parallel beta-helix repeat-containing protein [Bacteroidia bacterium]